MVISVYDSWKSIPTSGISDIKQKRQINTLNHELIHLNLSKQKRIEIKWS